jgi:hypothetical protein
MAKKVKHAFAAASARNHITGIMVFRFAPSPVSRVPASLVSIPLANTVSDLSRR